MYASINVIFLKFDSDEVSGSLSSYKALQPKWPFQYSSYEMLNMLLDVKFLRFNEDIITKTVNTDFTI
jgi:hypothetical protein